MKIRQNMISYWNAVALWMYRCSSYALVNRSIVTAAVFMLLLGVSLFSLGIGHPTDPDPWP